MPKNCISVIPWDLEKSRKFATVRTIADIAVENGLD
jgi:hypothetical protein